MCFICDKVVPGLTDRQKGEILIEIGLMIRDAELGHFDKSIDTLLDTSLEERSPLEEAHWEEEYRNRDEN
jgi:hypothetical protein